MYNDHPTAGDYAQAAAQDASNRARVNHDRINELEERLEVLEAVLRRQGFIPELQLDPTPWVWEGERFGTNERPETQYVRAFKPRKGYEQRAEAYGYRSQ